MPERHILGRTREAEAARIAAAFVAWLRDQATGQGVAPVTADDEAKEVLRP